MSLHLPHPRRLRARCRAPGNDSVKISLVLDTVNVVQVHRRQDRSHFIRFCSLIFSFPTTQLTCRVLELDSRINTPSPGLANGRQSKPTFSLPFRFAYSRFADRLTNDPSYRSSFWSRVLSPSTVPSHSLSLTRHCLRSHNLFIVIIVIHTYSIEKEPIHQMTEMHMLRLMLNRKTSRPEKNRNGW